MAFLFSFVTLIFTRGIGAQVAQVTSDSSSQHTQFVRSLLENRLPLEDEIKEMKQYYEHKNVLVSLRNTLSLVSRDELELYRNTFKNLLNSMIDSPKSLSNYVTYVLATVLLLDEKISSAFLI